MSKKDELLIEMTNAWTEYDDYFKEPYLYDRLEGDDRMYALKRAVEDYLQVMGRI